MRFDETSSSHSLEKTPSRNILRWSIVTGWFSSRNGGVSGDLICLRLTTCIPKILEAPNLIKQASFWASYFCNTTRRD